MSHVLALDQGTTSSRALVFDAAGTEVAKSQHEFEQHFPAPGLVEHDPEQIWATQERAMREAYEAAGRPKLAGIAITNQRETVVVFERATGRPLHPAIVWQDRRTTDVLAELQRQGRGPFVHERTGLPLDPYFSAAKIAWVLDRVPGARRRAEAGEVLAGTIDSWLLWQLTRGAVFATEPSNASRTSLYDLRTGDWSDELCDLFRVPRACLPVLRDSAGSFGTCAEFAAPITGILGDQQAALFGQGCTSPGSAKCTYGTGAFLLANAGERPPRGEHGLLATVAWRIAGRDTFALEGSVLVAGSLAQWLRDGLGIVTRTADLEALARSVPDSGGVVLVPAFQGLGTPHWDPDARGLLIGLTRATHKAHLARAGIEAIALSVDDVLRAMQRVLPTPLAALRVDGGAAANDLLLELQAALAGIPIERPHHLECTAFGAARMAMLGAGLARSLDELPRSAGATLRVLPHPEAFDLAMLRRRWESAVARSRGWAGV